MMAHDFETEFVGRKKPLFGLALRTSILTVITLGLYRFWMKTRLRRWYWSAIRPGGVPLEYVGLPLEKLLGFLVAVVILAFYIGVVNLILMFASFSLLGGSWAAYVLSFVGVVPIIFFASYRARRYILARTRWRGIRFGLEPGAWGYAFRCIWHWFLTIVTLGLLAPRQTFYLEKYRIDRTFYGDQIMTQGGTWRMLYPAMVHLIIGGVMTVATVAIGGANESLRFFYLLALSLPWLAFGWVHYQVETFRMMAAHKTLGSVGLVACPRVGRVVRIHVLGNVIVGLLLAALFFVLFAGIALGFDVDFLDDGLEISRGGKPLADGQLIALSAPLYFTFFILLGTFRNVFISLPLARHYAQTLTITGAAALDKIQQRDRDEFVEAEGFADALDVGAAI